jgi:hypothetical protein
MTQKQIENIKKKIKVCRARLATEKRMFGDYDDSQGLRYYIPELYLKIKDYKGALVYYRWFSKAFPDDIGYPDFNLFWAATLFENNKIADAIKKVYATAFSNTYFLDLISGRDTVQIDKSEPIGFESLDYAKSAFDDCIKLITLEFQIWIINLSEFDEFKNNMNKFISLQKLIKDEPTGQLRTELLQTKRKFTRQLTD